MASKNSSVVDSNDFHVNKLTSQDDISDFKIHPLIPFSYGNENLPTQTVVSAAAATTITAQIMRIEATAQWTILTALIPSITTTTATNNNTNCMNKNNTVKNTSSNLIQSSTDEEKNESEGCKTAYTSQQDAKEKFWFWTQINGRKELCLLLEIRY